jgi:hypothetical protein
MPPISDYTVIGHTDFTVHDAAVRSNDAASDLTTSILNPDRDILLLTRNPTANTARLQMVLDTSPFDTLTFSTGRIDCFNEEFQTWSGATAR